jgi:hypothetical protein
MQTKQLIDRGIDKKGYIILNCKTISRMYLRDMHVRGDTLFQFDFISSSPAGVMWGFMLLQRRAVASPQGCQSC